MNGTVVLIIGASSIAALASSLSHPKHRALTEGAISLVLLLAVASIVCEYLAGVVDKEHNYPDLPSIETGEGEYERVAKEAFILGIERLIAEEYGIDEGEVSVGCDRFDFATFTAERIYVTLSGGAVTADHKSIKYFIEDNFEGECIVEIEFG